MAYSIGTVARITSSATSPLSEAKTIDKDDVLIHVVIVGGSAAPSVTVNGVNAPLITGAVVGTITGTDTWNGFFFLENAAQGSQVVEVTFTGSGAGALVIPIGGLAATPAENGANVSADDGTTPPLNVTSAAGRLVVGGALGRAAALVTMTPGASETELDSGYGHDAGTAASAGGVFTEDGAATTTLSPTPDSAVGVWSIVGASFLVAVGDSVALTGTAVPSTDEVQIRAGGKTLILTLTGDTWVAAGATFDAERQGIINAFANAVGTEWNAERPNIAVTAVVRTSDTVVTITLPALAGFDITGQETIAAPTIPATALTGGVALTADQGFAIDPEAPPLFSVELLDVGRGPHFGG